MIADVSMPLGQYIGICVGIGFAGFMAGVQMVTRKEIDKIESRK